MYVTEYEANCAPWALCNWTYNFSLFTITTNFLSFEWKNPFYSVVVTCDICPRILIELVFWEVDTRNNLKHCRKMRLNWRLLPLPFLVIHDAFLPPDVYVCFLTRIFEKFYILKPKAEQIFYFFRFGFWSFNYKTVVAVAFSKKKKTMSRFGGWNSVSFRDKKNV